MSQEEALETPTNQALALLAFHQLHHPMQSAELVSAGYVGQEISRRLT